jgi:crotonobetaine/carnitine-CoA ligase
MSHGYNNDPEATAASWRNGWFHTGDVFVCDKSGDYYFVDRLKDTIRRRGENISSLEVELELLAHPSIREAAVVAVRSEHAEDEVLAVLSPIPGCAIDPVDLIEHLRSRLPHFMLPRFIRIVSELRKSHDLTVGVDDAHAG